MNRIVKIALAVGLVAIAILTFTYPQFMVAPGKLIPAHQQLDSNCFACHAPFRGATSERCIVCHKPADIGRFTTAGKIISAPKKSVPFHQQLINQDCLACHVDHIGVTRLKPKRFFDHALLKMDARDRCEACHTRPADALHRQISGNCGQCHNQNRWIPAAFDHEKYFVLDRNHNTRCITCHVGNNYRRYTCYGCHEHTPENIRSEHAEEGIRNVDNCVECHRSGDEDDIRGGDGETSREKKARDD